MELHLTLLVVVLGMATVETLWSDFELVSATNLIAANSRPFLFDLRVKRYKQGVYKLQGTITVTAPFDDYTAECIVLYSSKSNNQYVASPIRMTKGTLCKKLNGEYRNLLMQDLRNATTLPVTDDPDADLCTIFKETVYNINGYEYGRSVIPKFLSAGMYKLQLFVYKGEETTSGLEVLLRLI